MYNKVIMVGNLTRDVELKYLPNGSALAILGLASNRKYKKQDGTQGQEVCFVDVKLFGRGAEVANEYLRKGSKVLIEGRLSLESWTDQHGTKRSKHTIMAESMQMMDTKAQTQELAQEENARSENPTTNVSSGVSDTPIQENAQAPSKESQESSAKHEEIISLLGEGEEIPF
ncbi:single-stranded DNA-binding protein [Helicobacter sp. 11S03491-1]|uniref:single-stranded DNA-binding protein n=1 Tax=Helicobacter sp. 11S03491-1 TaxID=1476196 RepID=UPI000BA7A197|nr:single-stranded DNA-binding protein [Helicobacter sp. 11S03491-1]PAF42163.1 single-stranded DNA-binding protein [Helicobacter sp. 11S03491-1]